ncbi:MAG TPA: hypothetical protein VGF58_15275 [Burkholderiales bacterium]|jgi:hypothetical protein
MNKKESKQYLAAWVLVTERRQRSSGRVAHFQANASSVGNRLTLFGISVNGSVLHPLDGLLLGDGWNAQTRDLT